MEGIGARIRQVRSQARLTQSQFANEIGISQTHVSKIEKGVEHPSSSLIRLISIKYNIDEAWLNDGMGSSEPGWNLSTDEGAIAKYNAMRVMFERIMRNRTGKDLENTVEAFSYLVGLLSANGISNENESSYLKSVCLSIDLIEKQEFSTHNLGNIVNFGRPGKGSYQLLLHYKTDSEKRLRLIDQTVREMNNIILKQLGADTEL